MSWVGCLLKDSKLFILFAENSQIPLKISVIPVLLKFIYSEKATKFCEIFTLLLSSVVPVKSKVKILQNFVAFSEYMNFNFHLSGST